ncbi:hypothetical protein [Hyalangium sp.]|uniref:hypothetical protein n=1 Tax=Hyalangium sp. TaxID=2028555 RepID=UPI002D3B245C|nr:hypothetical protein [Hyalangium sp.]HYI00862.1 hypothetical protein [Hyalangium sp.]
MVESAFLSAVASYVSGLSLTPPLTTVGVEEQSLPAALPAVILSLEEAQRPRVGLGDSSAVVTGALAWTASIDLDDPYLPEDDSFSLLSPDRTRLTLPHGGLVRADGTEGALSSGDITVTVGGSPRLVVPEPPSGDDVAVDPAIGQLHFGSPLPTGQLVQVSYFLGQWERRVERLNGVLRLDLLATNASEVRTLSDAVVDALLGPGARQAVSRLVRMDLRSFGPIGLAEASPSTGRRRTARFAFEYERDVDRPESSGGVIQRIPIDSLIGVPG